MAAPIRIKANGRPCRPNTSSRARNVDAVPSSATRKAERIALVASSSVTIRSSAGWPPSHSCFEAPELVEGLMQHHPSHRPPRPLAAIRPAPLRPFQQTPRMQERLRPGAAPAKMVVAHQMLVKMLGREGGVPAAIKRFHLRLPIRRNPLARRLAKPPVQQARFASVLKTLVPASSKRWCQRRNVRSPTPKSSAASNWPNSAAS